MSTIRPLVERLNPSIVRPSKRGVAMANWSWVTSVHRTLYRRTDGLLGARLAGMEFLLLTTRGRKSGEPRTAPLPYFSTEDRLVIVGSNNGQDHDPAWWLNLQAEPEAEVRVRSQHWTVRARLATSEERETLWPWLKEQNPPYGKYELRTRRLIPVVILERVRD